MNLVHRTKAGERWDLIAWRYYRDVTQIARLMEVNPHAPATVQLPSGLELLVPLISLETVRSADGVPPWRR